MAYHLKAMAKVKVFCRQTRRKANRQGKIYGWQVNKVELYKKASIYQCWGIKMNCKNKVKVFSFDSGFKMHNDAHQ